MKLISAENISCQRGGRIVFQDLSFGLEGGQMIHLQGANGAGKSSLLRICASLLKAEKGSVEVGASFHYLGVGRTRLHPKISVAQNFAFWAALFGVEKTTEPLALWRAAHLAQMKPPSLSAGQAQTILLAQLALAPRRLWLLDEAFTNLDRARCLILQKEMERHLQKGGGVIIAEHHRTFQDAVVIDMDKF
jgi:heme exporter protein A